MRTPSDKVSFLRLRVFLFMPVAPVNASSPSPETARRKSPPPLHQQNMLLGAHRRRVHHRDNLHTAHARENTAPSIHRRRDSASPGCLHGRSRSFRKKHCFLQGRSHHSQALLLAQSSRREVVCRIPAAAMLEQCRLGPGKALATRRQRPAESPQAYTDSAR